MTCIFYQLKFTQTQKKNSISPGMICLSAHISGSVSHSCQQCIRMFWFVFQKFMLNLKPNEPNKDLSLYPNSGWFEATHYRRCFDLVPAAGTEFIFSSAHSSRHVVPRPSWSTSMPSQDYIESKCRDWTSWIIIILKRIEFSVSVFSFSSVKVSSNWLHI